MLTIRSSKTIARASMLAISILLFLIGGCGGVDSASSDSSTDGTSQDTSQASFDSTGTNQIVYSTATTTILAYAGSGGIEQSTLTFLVLDSDSNPLSGVAVSFSIEDPAGTSASLLTSTDTSNDTGAVTAVVQSGTRAGIFSVVATVGATTANSEDITVSSGLPTQSRISITLERNPANAFNTDGVDVDISAILSDILGNPVPDGTIVRFVSPESGSITPTCSTEGGACSATWTSASPRPSDGDVTILAYANGLEDFTDVDSDGIFDGTIDTFSTADDLGEAFADTNDDGIYNSGEFFVDSILNSTYDTGDGQWTTNGVVIYSNENLVLSNNTITLVSATPAINTTIDVSVSSATVTVTVSDGNNNSLPNGTTLAFSTDNGEIVGGSSTTIPNNFLAPIVVSIDIRSDGMSSTGGNLDLVVTTPSGDTATFSWIVND
ncbi:MAG: Ig-like domain-containing protein [Pseudomonadota bacterium]